MQFENYPDQGKKHHYFITAIDFSFKNKEDKPAKTYKQSNPQIFKRANPHKFCNIETKNGKDIMDISRKAAIDFIRHNIVVEFHVPEVPNKVKQGKSEAKGCGKKETAERIFKGLFFISKCCNSNEKHSNRKNCCHI